MKNALFILLLPLIVSIGCKKNEATTEVPIPVTIPSNYSNLEVGNYWIYQHFNLDANGNYIALNIFDSLYIEKDTLIGGNTYFKYWTDQLQGGALYPIYLRDSLQYTVRSDGSIFFATTNVIDTLETFCYLNATDTVYCTYAISSPTETSLNLNGGEFICRDLTTFYEISSFSLGLSDKIVHRYMAKDVGLIYETLLPTAGNPNYRVRKLVSYGKNE